MKDFKIERKVFDDRTLLAIYKLMTKGIIKSVESIVKEGKESVVVSAKSTSDEWLALKIYRTVYVDFKSMWKYLVADHRFKNVKKSRRFVINSWCKREFKNLEIAHSNNVACPRPVAFNENILAMAFIGEDGNPAPRLVDIRLENPEEAYKLILDELESLSAARLVHTDLSEYNILVHDSPYIIDFSQAVTSLHPQAFEFLKRDIKNLNRYFERQGVEVVEKEILEKNAKLLGLE